MCSRHISCDAAECETSAEWIEYMCLCIVVARVTQWWWWWLWLRFAIGFLFDYSESEDVGCRKIEILVVLLHMNCIFWMRIIFQKIGIATWGAWNRNYELYIDFQLLMCAIHGFFQWRCDFCFKKNESWKNLTVENRSAWIQCNDVDRPELIQKLCMKV